MVCIYCGEETRVTNSRIQRRNNHIWRRRTCLACSSLFTTHELPDLNGSIVVRKPDNKLEPFSRDKLFLAIYKSCEHRALAIEDAGALTQIVLAQLLAAGTKAEIAAPALTHTVREVLGRFDTTAAAVFSAYHP